MTADIIEMTSESINRLFDDSSTAIAKDLKLNLKKLLTEGALSPEEASLTLLATATSLEFPYLIELANQRLAALQISSEQIQEARETAALMGMLNIYYRFRHMIKEGQGQEAEQRYKMTGLRMNSMARPVLGKVLFEMLSLAVSVLNGCAMCINAHEQTLRNEQVSDEKIHDLVRLASVVNAVKTLKYSM
ncbi:carboxymuconolactone decarboxylase family protein [bacterium]|nr:carboxymuconolactone decarboxylase family protein [bacterium]MCP5462172.1 carboxymuconolactone decarboxylase family protein [bacterium]